MNERLVPIFLSYGDVAGGAGGDAVANSKLPFKGTPVAASVSLDMVSGAPSGCVVDFNDDTVAITGLSAIEIGATAGVVTQVLTVHMGGAVAVPVDVAKASIIGLDVTPTAGTTPKVRVTAVIWFLVGEG